MADHTKLIERLDASTEKFLNTLDQIPEDKFTVEPQAGGWSAAGIAEHLLITENLVNQVVAGPRAGEPRDPMEKAEEIGYKFLNFEEKMTGPQEIAPKGEITTKTQVIDQLNLARHALKDQLKGEDTQIPCTSFSHALFGELSAAEWAWFNMYHAERHRKQMEVAVWPEKAAELVAPKTRNRPQRPQRAARPGRSNPRRQGGRRR